MNVLRLCALALIAIGKPALTWANNSGCLCTFGQSCWPSTSMFSQLQSQVSQPLVYPRPSASACYPPSNPSGNCTAVHVNWDNGFWRSSLPGGMESPYAEAFTFPNGTTDACYLDTTITGTCGQGSVPAIGVDARSVEDIQAAVTFAVQHNLKVVVKNTGHDYLGRSTARGSFLVWTHNMKNITYDSTFVPQGGPAHETYEAVTLGVGVQWGEAYIAMNDYGRTVVGASEDSIGVGGGWLAGGGHSSLSPTHGLGVDNALEISVVLSTGEFLTVNQHQNPDLFWALRGGGGPTYGIVTSVTYRTYPTVPCQLYTYQANITNSSVATDLVGGILRYQTQFTDDGWGGYVTITGQNLSFFYFGPNMTNETATATTQGWRDFSASLAPYGVVSTEQMTSAPSWYVLYEAVIGSVPQNGVDWMFTSRLLSRETLANNSIEITELLLGCQTAYLLGIGGGKVNQIDADSAGLNPAWRNAVAEALCGFIWQDGTPPAEVQSMISQLKGWAKELYELLPGSGAYLNEASLYEIDWQKTFFGSHYSALKSIKDRYDPHRLFVVAEGVGSEEWNANLTCRK